MDQYFEEKPNEHSLEIIRRRCYSAMSLYLHFWKNKNNKNVFNLDEEDVVFLSSEETFKENIKRLQLEHLITFIKMKDKYIIKILE